MIEKTRFALAQKYQRVPSNKEIANFLEYSESQINEAIMAGKEIMSLDNEQDMSLYETIKSEEKINLDDQILLKDSLSSLTNDEKEIIKQALGLI